ncbi:hypothetical protein CHLRE_10g444950v5 [Chlamydomonas reinhardtii]|uniref:Uncharacterized protein n=1 Tax=Chlamydomonas reinhardtii TaxID=3055 RepID=A0A2K3DAQ9_CHLRE|nr:uncharacterized protein CHLRE_10g444950v5 [Chlamydomonas reinhardtii]PNW77625.1 hypothetical protein CHLRE_10g444950v5 [Chlamydomonas reinhardtii]
MVPGQDPVIGEQLQKRASKGNELVQVNGFTFIRKRKTTAAAPADVAVDAAASAPVLLQPEAGGGAEPAVEQDAGPHQDTVVGSEELLDAAELQEDGGDAQPSSSGVQAERNVAAEVASLASFVPSQCPAGMAVTWMLEQALNLAVNADADSVDAAVAAQVLSRFRTGLDEQVAGAQQLLEAGSAEELQCYDALPGMVKQLCAGSRAAAGLRAKLAALEQEEAAWLQLQAKYPEAALAAALASRPAAASEAAAAAVPRVCLNDVLAAQRRADMQLGFQVEALGTMLDKAEQLVEQAQQACSLLQAEYHKENFQVYAHVNSPQVLVKILSQAVPPASALDFVPASQPSQYA